MRGILFILLGTLIALPAAAANGEETTWYDVELIVFTPSGDEFLDAEAWPQDVALPQTENARALLPAPKRPPRTRAEVKAFQSLTPAELQLGGAYRRLEASSQFEPLIHLGWRQPGLEKSEAVPIRITLDADGAPLKPGEEAEMAQPGLRRFDLPRLDGTITVVLSRYLHLNTDLVYRVKAVSPMTTQVHRDPAVIDLGAPGLDGVRTRREILLDPGPSVAEPQYFEIVVNSSRRMRSKELHYLDHPVVGVIALITPYEMPKPPRKPAEVAPVPTNGGVIER